MELVLAGLRWHACLAYLDDIIVFGRTFEEHLQRLREVLGCLWEANLKVNHNKCQFFRTILGHIVSRDAIRTDPGKVECIENWTIPRDTDKLLSLLGLAS